MAYNFKKNTCDKCKITKDEAEKHPVDTGVNHPFYRYSTSFKLGLDGSVLCAACAREQELEWAIEAIDRAEGKS